MITAADGGRWGALSAWVDWPQSAARAGWQCRSGALTVSLPAAGDVHLLPLDPGFPTASLALPTGALPLTAQVGTDGLRLVAAFDTSLSGRQSYDATIVALSHEGGAVLTLSSSHHLGEDVIVTGPDAQPLTLAKQQDALHFPDLPAQPTDLGWLQVVPAGSPRSLHCRAGSRPELFYYAPSAYKLAFHADGDRTPGLPFRVSMARDARDEVIITVALTALPYLSDADRGSQREHLLQHVLQGTQSYVDLALVSGLGAGFEGDFLSDGVLVAGSSIRYELAGAASGDVLEIRFTMQALDYGLLVPMLQRGITGRVVLTQDASFTVTVPVDLRLDDVITDAVRGTVAGASAPTSGSDHCDVTVTNPLAYPVRLSSLDLAVLCVGDASGLLLDAEELTLLAEPLLLAAGATSASLQARPHLPAWNRTSVLLGEVTVTGPSPQDWIAMVNRDPSLQPSRRSVTVSPSLPAAQLDAIRSVTVAVFEAGQPAPRQAALDIAPGHDAVLELDFSLAELAAGTGARDGYLLEFTTRFVDDSRSLPQRVALDLSRTALDLLVLWDAAATAYFVDGDTSVGPVTREVATQLIDGLRAAGKPWGLRTAAG